MHSPHRWFTAFQRTRPWRARMAPCVLAAALAAPGAASPCELDALLRMPLEQLLQLRVAPRRAARAEVPNAAMARLADRRRHDDA